MKELLLRNCLPLILLVLCFEMIGQKAGNRIFDTSYVHEIRFEFEQSDYWNTMILNYESSWDGQPVPYIMGDVIIDGERVDSVGVRFKGFTSYTYDSDKKPFKIDFNEFVKGKRYDGLRKLNLNNGTGDPAMLRDVICYDLLRSSGVGAPRTSFSVVYVNDQFWGLYQNIEQVDKEFLERNFSNNKGNLFKNKGWSHLEYNGPNKTDYNNIFELKTNEEGDDWNGFISLMDVLNNSSDSEFAERIEDHFDVDRYLKTLAVDVATNNWDSYLQHGRNWYMYEDTSTGVFHWIPWDYNFALGSYFGVGPEDTTLCELYPQFIAWTDGSKEVKFYNESFSNRDYTLLWDFGDGNTSTEENPVHTYEENTNYLVCIKMIVNDQCQEEMCENVNTAYDYASCNSVENGSFTGDVNYAFVATVSWNSSCCNFWSEDCDNIYDFFSDSGEGGDSGFAIDQRENQGVLINRLLNVPEFNERYYDFFCELMNYHFTEEYMHDFIDYNRELIEDYIEEDPNYLFNFSDFLKDSGEEGLKEYISDRTADLLMVLDSTYECPKFISSIPYQDIVINELVASNDSTSGISDANGGYGDWIELYNNTDEEVNLSGIYLSDSKTDFKKWAFPEGTLIGGDDYLIVWADKDVEEEGLHSNFKLSKSQDEVRLSNPDGSVIDSVSFSDQITNVGFARIPNGTGEFEFRSTTFASNNNQSSNTTDINSELSVRLSPNPAFRILVIESDDFKDDIQLEVYTLNGKRLLTKEQQLFESGKISLDVDRLDKGMYLIKIRSNSKEGNLKFVKM